MEEAVRRTRPRRTAALTIAVCAAMVVACGEDEDHANKPTPPVPITVTALVDEDSISLSPDRVGGGVVRFIIANQSEEPQEVSVRAEGERGVPVTQVTQPIAVGGTGELKLDLEPGVYEVATDSNDIAPGTLEVGPQRPAGQDQLMLP